MLHNKRSHHNEKPEHCNEEQPPLAATRESLHAAMKTQCSQKEKEKNKVNVVRRDDPGEMGKGQMTLDLKCPAKNNGSPWKDFMRRMP